jgi:hypothetical protein
MARLTLNLGQIVRFMPIWLTSRTFPTFIVGLLPSPLPPYQTPSCHLYKFIVLCLWPPIVRPDHDAVCSSPQSLLVLPSGEFHNMGDRVPTS